MTPGQIAILATEVALPAYAGMTDEQVANALNAPSIATDVDADCPAIQRYMIERGLDGRFRARIARVTAELGHAVGDVYQRANAATPDAPALAAAEARRNALEVRLARLENIWSMFTRAADIATSSTQRRNAVFADIDWLRDAEQLLTTGTGADNERNALRLFAAGLVSRTFQLFGRGVRVDAGHVSRARV